MKKSIAFLSLGLAASLLAGCATSRPKAALLTAPPAVVVTNTLNADLLQPSPDAFVLGPGDQLDVQIIGNPASHATLTVGLDGKIYFSVLPGIDVWGLTLQQARARIESDLAKYMNNSQTGVALKAVGSKYVWLLGRVNTPGIYPLPGPVTLLEALSLAGGIAKSPSAFTTQDIGDLRHSFVMREGHMLPVNFVRLIQEGDLSQNIYLKPDDFVFIPSSLSQEVYVLGAVASPRTVPFSDPMSVISALAGANGPIKDAYLSHVAIVRGSLDQPQIIQTDYNAILKGQTANVRLEPGDIVYVPFTPYKFATDYAEFIVNTFVRAWTANMGVRSVLGGSQVGVSAGTVN